MDIPEILDITAVDEGRKGAMLLEKFGGLPLGGYLVLNLDRDPRPLYFHLLEHTGRNFSWKPLESGPEVWQVRLGKRYDLYRDDSIGQMVIDDPRKAAVFKKLGIDYSCGGARTLTEACEAMQLDANMVLLMLKGDLAATSYPAMDFVHWDTGFFCKYLVNLHHGYVRSNLPFLLETSEKIARSYGAKYPELHEVHSLVEQVAEGLVAIMVQEEELLFPYLTSLAYALKSGTRLAAPAQGSVKPVIFTTEAAHERIYNAFFPNSTVDPKLPAAQLCHTWISDPL